MGCSCESCETAVTGWDNGRWLTIFVRGQGREIVAGLHGWTWGQTGFVQTRWVREDLRGVGSAQSSWQRLRSRPPTGAAVRCIGTFTATRRRTSLVTAV
jgi:hypothetical protein